MRTHKLRLKGLLTAATVCGTLIAGSSPAMARVVYIETSHFGSAGSGEGQFSSPSGVAIDSGSGDVYVVDGANSRVERFDATGGFLSQFDGSETPAKAFLEPLSIAVDNSGGPAKGDVYVTDRGNDVVDVFDASGKYVRQLTGGASGPFHELIGVAVDQTGNLWLEERTVEQIGEVYEFTDTGAPLIQFSTNEEAFDSRGVEARAAFAVDAQDNLYVEQKSERVAKLDSTTHGVLGEWSNFVFALALNPATNNLFVDTGGKVEEYGPFGEPYGSALAQTQEGTLSESYGVAVNGATGILYASERANSRVNLYKRVILPDVSTVGSSNVRQTAATLGGTVNPDGIEATCQVEYGTSASYGESAPCVPSSIGAGSGEVPVRTVLSGLSPNTTYHYRFSATNTNGTTTGSDATFTTPPEPPVVSISAAQFVSPEGALFFGTVDTQGSPTKYHFVYGTTTAYGLEGPASDSELPASTGPQVISKQIEGLRPDTTYHFALVATNAGKERVQSADMTFVTPAAKPAPAALTLGASAVAQSIASVSGTVDARSVQTTYELDLGTDTAYGVRIFGDAGSGEGPQTVTVELQGLAPGSVYHYRFIAINRYGTSYGADQAFATGVYPGSVLVAPPSAPLISAPPFVAPKASTASVGSGVRVARRGKASKRTRVRKAKKRVKSARAGRSRRGGRGK